MKIRFFPSTLPVILAVTLLQAGLLQADENPCWPLDPSFDAESFKLAEEDLAARWQPAQRYADFLADEALLKRLQLDSTPEARLMAVALTLHQATEACDASGCSSLVLRGSAGQTALAELTSLATDYPHRFEFSMAALRLCHAVRDDQSTCLDEYADALHKRFPDNAAAAFVSAAAALERGNAEQLRKRLGAAGSASYYDSGEKAVGQIGISLLDRLLPPATDGELEALRKVMVYSRPGLDYLSLQSGLLPGQNTLVNYCANPPDDRSADLCLRAAQSMRLPGARGALNLDAELIEIKIIDGSGSKPSEAVNQMVREYGRNQGPPRLDWADPKAYLQYLMDTQELGYFGALDHYRELEQTCTAKGN